MAHVSNLFICTQQSYCSLSLARSSLLCPKVTVASRFWCDLLSVFFFVHLCSLDWYLMGLRGARCETQIGYPVMLCLALILKRVKTKDIGGFYLLHIHKCKHAICVWRQIYLSYSLILSVILTARVVDIVWSMFSKRIGNDLFCPWKIWELLSILEIGLNEIA